MGRVSPDAPAKRFRMSACVGVLTLAALCFTSLCLGRYKIEFRECLGILLHTADYGSTARNVIFSLRIPRAITAALIGTSLSVSGLVFQSTFQNKLISPDILGASSGSCAGAAIAIMLGLPKAAVSGFAFAFGLAAVGAALLIPYLIRNRSTLALVLSGVIVGAFSNSVIGLIKFLADPNRKLAEITYWIMGSIAGVDKRSILSALPLVVIPCVVLYMLRWKINVMALGETEACTLGIDYKLTRLVIIVCATLLTSASVSISGSVGWIGLVIPHLARLIAGEDHRFALPTTAILGANFMVLVDMLARTLSMNEIPLSIITGFLGTPLYIVLLTRKRTVMR